MHLGSLRRGVPSPRTSNRYTSLNRRRPILTQALTAAAIGAVGDVLMQMLELRWAAQHEIVGNDGGHTHHVHASHVRSVTPPTPLGGGNFARVASAASVLSGQNVRGDDARRLSLETTAIGGNILNTSAVVSAVSRVSDPNVASGGMDTPNNATAPLASLNRECSQLHPADSLVMRRSGVETDTGESTHAAAALTATDCGTDGPSASTDRVSAYSDDTVADIQANGEFIDINDTTHARCGSHQSNGTSRDPIHWPNHGLTTGHGHDGVHRSCSRSDQDAQRSTGDSTEYNERSVVSCTQLNRQGSVSAAHSIDGEQKLDWRRTANMAVYRGVIFAPTCVRSCALSNFYPTYFVS